MLSINSHHNIEAFSGDDGNHGGTKPKEEVRTTKSVFIIDVYLRLAIDTVG